MNSTSSNEYKKRDLNLDIGFERFEEDFYANPNTAFVKPNPDARTPYEQYDASENYKLYRKHKTELFEMIYNLWRNAPPLPIFATEEEKDEHKKKMNEYLESIRPDIRSRLKALGFGKEN